MWIVLLLAIGFMVAYLFIKRFQIQIALLEFSIIPYALWVKFVMEKRGYVPLFAIEGTLLNKFFGMNTEGGLYGLEEIDGSFELAVLYFVFIYIFVVWVTKVTKLNTATLYGNVASIAIGSIIQIINSVFLNNKIPGVVIFIVVLAGTVLFMRKGFHSFDLWIPTDKNVLGLIVGIIPALIFMYCTICNVFTISFGNAVVGKLSYAIVSLILTVVFLGVGIFLYFRFQEKYWEIMKEKAERIQEKANI